MQRAAKRGARKAEEQCTSYSGPIDIFTVETKEQSFRAAFDLGAHSPDCILRAAPYFGKCMSCPVIQTVAESPPVTDLAESTDFCEKPLFKTRSHQEQQDFAQVLRDLVGDSP
jgi:hypothetical protein